MFLSNFYFNHSFVFWWDKNSFDKYFIGIYAISQVPLQSIIFGIFSAEMVLIPPRLLW